MKKVTGLPLDLIEGIICSIFTLQVGVLFHICSCPILLIVPLPRSCLIGKHIVAQVSNSWEGMLNSDFILDKYIIFQPKTSIHYPKKQTVIVLQQTSDILVRCFTRICPNCQRRRCDVCASTEVASLWDSRWPQGPSARTCLSSTQGAAEQSSLLRSLPPRSDRVSGLRVTRGERGFLTSSDYVNVPQVDSAGAVGSSLVPGWSARRRFCLRLR